MENKDLYLILEDASSYESGSVAKLVDITDNLEAYLAHEFSFISSHLSARDFSSLDDLLTQHIVKADDLTDHGDIMLATKVSPDIATYCGGYTFHDMIKQLLSKGSKGIEGQPIFKRQVEEIIKGIKEAYKADGK